VNAGAALIRARHRLADEEKPARPVCEEQICMDVRKYVPIMLGEYWVYLLALANSAVIATLLYTREGPIHFGLW
jgi:hypothetical protein